MTDLETIYEPEDGYPPDDEHRERRLPQANAVPKGGGARLLQKERARRALELRKAGSTYKAIADALGYADHTSASAAVKRAMDEVVQEPAIELRGIQIERLNHMLLVKWPAVQAGDDRAIATCLSIMDRLNALMGTEAPKQVDVNVQSAVLVIDGDKDNYIAHMRKMAMAEDEPLPALGVGSDHDIIDAEVISDRMPKKKVRMKSKEK